MEKELAHHVAYESFMAATKISNLIPLLKQHCDKEEFEPLARRIASISADIHQKLLNHVVAEYPEIEVEMNDKIKKYSVLLA